MNAQQKQVAPIQQKICNTEKDILILKIKKTELEIEVLKEKKQTLQSG